MLQAEHRSNVDVVGRRSDPSLPQGLIIGLGRAGTTFMQRCLEADPASYVPAAKDSFFFDREFHRGRAWYERFFAEADGLPAFEVSHDYFFHPSAPSRVVETLGSEVRLVLVLREPTSWVQSVVNREIAGGMHGKLSTEQALARTPGLISAGNYLPFVRNWLASFGDGQLSILLYDDLKADPVTFYKSVAEALGFESKLKVLPEAVNASATARSRRVNQVLFSAAKWLRAHGQVEMVGYLKKHPALVRLAFQPDAPPKAASDLTAELRALYRPGVVDLENEIGKKLLERWYR